MNNGRPWLIEGERFFRLHVIGTEFNISVVSLMIWFMPSGWCLAKVYMAQTDVDSTTTDSCEWQAADII
jgi:hypothetical protein